MIPLLIAGSTVITGEALNAIRTGDSPVVQAATGLIAAATAIIPGVVDRRNTGAALTEAQITSWMRKVGRPASLRGSLTIVPRVRTSPYLGSDNTAMSLRGFADAAGRGTGTGIKGGYCLAVLCSVETNAGVGYLGRDGHPKGMNASMYNNNPGNTKYYTAGAAHDNPTPAIYGLVDRLLSIDMYESHADLAAGIHSWGQRTFLHPSHNTRGPYGEPSASEALTAGDLNAFCAAIGRAHYAASYTASRTALQARAKYLCREAPYQHAGGVASLDTGIMVYR